MKEINAEPIVIKGSEPGKRLVILAGVHGNELCGVEAFKEIIPSLSIKRGTVTFLIGDPGAVREKKRFLDQNLNRLFKDEQELSENERASREFTRSRELMTYLDEADALLDIHSSGTANSTPFIICEERSYSVAMQLPAPIISSGWDAIEPGGTDYYMNKRGGLGICIECGYHDDPATFERAKEAIPAFLKAMGAIDSEDAVFNSSKRFIHVTSLYKTKIDFKKSRTFNDFELIESNTVIGTDGDEEVKAPSNCLVLFVRDRMKGSEEAFLLAQEK